MCTHWVKARPHSEHADGFSQVRPPVQGKHGTVAEGLEAILALPQLPGASSICVLPLRTLSWSTPPLGPTGGLNNWRARSGSQDSAKVRKLLGAVPGRVLLAGLWLHTAIWVFLPVLELTVGCPGFSELSALESSDSQESFHPCCLNFTTWYWILWSQEHQILSMSLRLGLCSGHHASVGPVGIFASGDQI